MNDPRQRVADAIREKLKVTPERCLCAYYDNDPQIQTPVLGDCPNCGEAFDGDMHSTPNPRHEQLVAALGELERECDDTYGCSGRGHAVLGRINLYLDPDPHERCNGTGFILNDELDHLSESNPERVAWDIEGQLRRVCAVLGYEVSGHEPRQLTNKWEVTLCKTSPISVDIVRGYGPTLNDAIADAIVAKVQA